MLKYAIADHLSKKLKPAVLVHVSHTEYSDFIAPHGSVKDAIFATPIGKSPFGSDNISKRYFDAIFNMANGEKNKDWMKFTKDVDSLKSITWLKKKYRTDSVEAIAKNVSDKTGEPLAKVIKMIESVINHTKPATESFYNTFGIPPAVIDNDRKAVMVDFI